MAPAAEDAQPGEKRRHSTRLRRESAVKRQAIEPEIPPAKPKEIPRARAPGRPKKEEKQKGGRPRKSLPEAVPVDESPEPRSQVLPTRIKESEPLPTLDCIRTDEEEEYQSLKESGVLAAALARSRKRWVTEGVLDKYWTKPPPKKRGDGGPRQKAPGERIGSCTLTVEPHSFDISMYIIKENLPPSHPQYHQYAPPVAPQQQYRPPNPPHHPLQPAQQQRTLPTPPARPPPVAAPTPTPPTQPQQTQPDPVIHMLAQRASTNPELKSVMKIVATGGANQEQLDYFQRHIDELTKLAKKQQEPKKPPAPAYNQNTFQHQPYHAPQRPVQAAPPPAVRINAVLIDFALDTTSRYLFPANSILEYGPGFKSCTASFLIKRKASQAEDVAHYREVAAALNRMAVASHKELAPVPVDDMVFWQPVTVHFASESGNMLEMLARVVKPPNEVKAWMERVLNGEEVEPPKPPTAAEQHTPDTATIGAKQEESKALDPSTTADPVSPAKSKTKYPSGAFRADAAKLALQLPKEDKGKENEG